MALAYEFLIMILTDIITHQVGSYFHMEVLYIALIAAASSFLAAACLLPRNPPAANRQVQPCITEYMQNAGSFAPVEQP